MLNEGYLSCIGELNKRLINFHKDILKNYLRPLGANPLGFLESYFGLRMFRSPGVEMLNLPEIEMVYLIQPMMNTLSMEEGLNSEEKPSAYPSVEGQVKGLLLETRRKAISGGSANLIKGFLPIYKHKYIPAFIESLFYKRLKFKQDRIHSDSETSSAARTAKSEIFTRRKEIFFGRGKFDLTTPKGLDLLDHIPFPTLQESKVADTDLKMPVFLQKKPIIPSFSTMDFKKKILARPEGEIQGKHTGRMLSRISTDNAVQNLFLEVHNTHNLKQIDMHSYRGTSFATNTVGTHPFPAIASDMFSSSFRMQGRRPTFLSGNTVINGTKEDLDNWDSKIASHLPDQQSPSFLQRSNRVYPGRLPEVLPILHIKRSSLRMHKFIPMIDTQHTRMKKDALSDEHASFSSQLIFVDRHHNSSRSLKVMRVKENTNSRKDIKSYPIGFEPSGLTAQAQHSVDYELIADRVYDIIENRLRIEKERE